MFYWVKMHCGRRCTCQKEAVLGANVVLTKSTKIFDVSKKRPGNKGFIPERSVVIPGAIKRI